MVLQFYLMSTPAKVLEHVNRVLETDIRLLQLLNQSALWHATKNSILDVVIDISVKQLLQLIKNIKIDL